MPNGAIVEGVWTIVSSPGEIRIVASLGEVVWGHKGVSIDRDGAGWIQRKAQCPALASPVSR